MEQQTTSLQRQAAQDQQAWAKRVRALEQRTFACEADALVACTEARKGVPAWLEVTFQVASSTHHARRGRPGPDAVPEVLWRVYGAVRLVETTLGEEARRKASFIVASNLPASRKSAEEVLRLYKAQSGVERGFAFLKDPLFLASSVFVKKVERVMATGFVMVLCLLVYRLAEHRIRQRLAETGATVPDQLKKPTQRPTLRWLFQCFEGISLVLMQHEAGEEEVQVTGLNEVHRLILSVLGPAYQQFYESSK